MDYGRLAIFMLAATATMALATHLWCWVYAAFSWAATRRLASRLEREEAELGERRANAPRYQTYEQFRADLVGSTPVDEILDRLDGKFPPKAADVQSPGPSSTLPATTLAMLGGVALVACIYGGFRPSQDFLYELMGVSRPKPPKGRTGSNGVDGGSGLQGARGA